MGLANSDTAIYIYIYIYTRTEHLSKWVVDGGSKVHYRVAIV